MNDRGENKEEPILVLNVYMESTFGILKEQKSLTALLKRHTVSDNKNSHTLGFDGFAVNPELLDFKGIFSYGLTQQINIIIEKITQILNINKEKNLIINGNGSSRSGPGLFLLCKQLNSLPKNLHERIKVNLAIFDPVPGNLPMQTKIDFLKHSLANQIADMTDCPILKKLLLIYIDKPQGKSILEQGETAILPDISPYCETEVILLHGTHMGSQSVKKEDAYKIRFFDECAFISFSKIKSFLESNGTQFDFSGFTFHLSYDNLKIIPDPNNSNTTLLITEPAKILRETNNCIIDLYNSMLVKMREANSTIRIMHKDKQINALKNKKFVNVQHQQLCGQNQSIDEIALSITDNNTHEQRSGCYLQ